MLSPEQARQIGCVVNRLRFLMEAKAKGSLTIHLNGGGEIGQQFDESLKHWRDKFSSEKMGITLEEDEFIKIMLNQK